MTTGQTPALGLPFPNGDDPVASGDDLWRQLVTKLDTIANPVTARLFMSVATQAVSTSTIQRVQTITPRPALTGGWTQNGNQLIAPRAGEYSIRGQVSWASTTVAGSRLTLLTVNHPAGAYADASTVVAQSSGYLGATAGVGYSLQAVRSMRLAAGDKIEMWGRQITGANLDLVGNVAPTGEGIQSWLEATYLGSV